MLYAVKCQLASHTECSIYVHCLILQCIWCPYILSLLCFFASVYSCYCIVYAYLPTSGLLVSYVNVFGDAALVCLSLGSLPFPLRLQAPMVLIFILNHYCRPSGDRIVLWVSGSYYWIMLFIWIILHDTCFVSVFEWLLSLLCPLAIQLAVY